MKRSLPFALSACLLAACHDHDHPGAGDGYGAEHGHAAPHGGALVVLGDELAHLEFVLDPATGRLEAFVLDGSADRGVRIAATELVLVLEDEPPFEVRLSPVASELTGETVGDTSAFEGADPRLVGRTEFIATLRTLALKGQLFEGVSFPYPGGNEDGGDHHAEED